MSTSRIVCAPRPAPPLHFALCYPHLSPLAAVLVLRASLPLLWSKGRGQARKKHPATVTRRSATHTHAGASQSVPLSQDASRGAHRSLFRLGRAGHPPFFLACLHFLTPPLPAARLRFRRLCCPDVSRPDKISGADIAAICQEAGMQAVRKNRYVILPKDFEKGYKAHVKKGDLDFQFYR